MDSEKGQVAFCRNMQTLEIYRTMHVSHVSRSPGNEFNWHEINASCPRCIRHAWPVHEQMPTAG